MKGRVLAALAASVALAGCGAHAVVDAPSLDEVAAATRADPYRFELSMKSDGLTESFTGTATGAADPAADRGVIRYSFVADGEKMTLEVRRVGGATYTRFTAPEWPGKWEKESTTEADETVGPFGMFSEPHRVANALARHGRNVEAESGEEIDGIPTTHYRASAPTIEILGSELKGERREELETEIRETDSEMTQVDAWAGTDGLLRKLALSIPITEEGERGQLITSARFYDFGTAIDVEAPPASEIRGSGYGSESSGPCEAEAAPHSAEAVMAAFRGEGFKVTAYCDGNDTTIFAFPEDGEDGAYCVVAAAPRDRSDVAGSIAAGNVLCVADSDASRELVRRLLRGLQR